MRLFCLLLLTSCFLSAQNAPPAQGLLTITVLEGDDAILNVRQRVGRETIIQVEDENRRPVGGALLAFTSPDSGASAVFPNGSRFTTLYTNEQGQATLRGIRPNQVSGRYTIRIKASKDGKTGVSEIRMTNVAPTIVTTGGISTKLIVAIVAGAAAATGVGIAVATGGGGTPQIPAPPVSTLRLQPGTSSVGPPR